MSKTIKTFDRTSLRLLRAPIEEALKGIETEYGISIKLGNASYNPSNATFKLELATVGADGTAISKEATALKTYGVMFGLPKDSFEQTFNEGKHTFKIIGLRTKASRYPVLVERADGKVFCYPVDRVAKALNTKAWLAKGGND
jgi:hypothetical protein